MLDIHPNATENFNKKADHLLTFIRDIEPSNVHSPSFEPETHSAIQIDGSMLLNTPKYSVNKDVNNYTIRLYLNSELSIGILEDGCLKLRKLLEELYKIKDIKCKVSIKTLETILCTWITAKFHDPSYCEFCEFLKVYVEKIIGDYEIVIPINFLHIEKSFALGKVNFRPFSKKSIDELLEGAVTQAQDSLQKDLVRKLFDQNIRQFQGYAVATILLQAEPARAYEIAIEETNTALSMLRIFSSSTREPLSYYSAAVWGSSNISKGYLIALKEGNLNQMFSKTLDRRPMSEYLNNQAIDDLYLAGLSILDKLLGLSKRNPFQETLLATLILYSRSAILKDIADKLVYILVALESIFLRNSSEPIQQNLGERIAFLIGDSLEKRKRIIKVTRETYTLRSRFVHHGHSIDDDLETMREFMQYAWQAIVSLIHQSNSVSTVDALLDMLDDRKLS
jgi:hypothetical protein